MCDALNELFADKVECARENGLAEGEKKGRAEGRSEGRYESLRNLLKNSPYLKLEEGARLLGFSGDAGKLYSRLFRKKYLTLLSHSARIAHIN